LFAGFGRSALGFCRHFSPLLINKGEIVENRPVRVRSRRAPERNATRRRSDVRQPTNAERRRAFKFPATRPGSMVLTALTILNSSR